MTTSTSTRNAAASKTTHNWTEAQLAFLRRHPRTSGPELCRKFRAKFRRASGELTDKAIVNRRYFQRHADERAAYAANRRAAQKFARQINVAVFV